MTRGPEPSTPQGSVSTGDAPTFLAPDRTGRYLLSAYYQGGYAAVYPLGPDGAVGAPLLDRQDTAVGAHAIATDPSNRFAFVPHISRVQDNVLEPPKNIPGPNFIAQFRFDAETGRLTPNAPFRVEQGELVGPRHYCFHPDKDLVYFSDEQGCSVSVYRLDAATGTLVRGAARRHVAGRLFRPEYLLADPSDPVGEIPVCRQSGP